MPDCTLIGFVRDPIERLQSAWRYFSPCGQAGIPKGCSWPQFVDAVLSGEMVNHHWMSMEGWYRTENLYRFEDLRRIWESIKLPPLGHHRVSDHSMPTPNYRVEELREIYAYDLELRRCL